MVLEIEAWLRVRSSATASIALRLPRVLFMTGPRALVWCPTGRPVSSTNTQLLHLAVQPVSATVHVADRSCEPSLPISRVVSRGSII